MAERISTLVLFGATGDLASRMLLPSLYGLDADGLLPDKLRIIGTARTELDDAGLRARATEALQHYLPEGFYSAGIAERFLARLHYVPLDITDQAGFARLAEAIGDPCHGVAIFLSTAPSLVQAGDRRPRSRGPRLSDGPHGARKTARERPRIRAARSTMPSPPISRRTARSGSTIIWARRRSRT